MIDDMGVSPDGAGLSPPVEPASSLDGSATSIPDADEIEARLSDPAFQRQQCVELLAAKIGYAFKRARILRGLTQQELAAKSGCSVALVRRLESGQYLEGMRMIGRWAYELDVEIEFKVRPRPAIAIEAEGGNGVAGAVHESAGRNGIAQDPGSTPETGRGG